MEIQRYQIRCLFLLEVRKIKNLSRQDRNGTRNSEELRRRYQFNDIDYTKEEIEKLKTQIITDDHLSTTSTNPVQNKIVTQALNNKVNKETGKGLSTNDFTDEDKEKLDNATTNNHTHSNKTLLDTYKQTESNLADAVSKKHSHSNKTILDTYTKTEEEILSTIGEIIESGSNNNGNYIKYSDGTMICFDAYTPDTQDTIYHYYNGTWTFPIAFIEMPLVTGTADSWNTAMASVKVRATATNCRVMLHFLALNTMQAIDSTCAVNLVAIGRWK